MNAIAAAETVPATYPRLMTEREVISYCGHVPETAGCNVFQCEAAGQAVVVAPTGERGFYCASHAESIARRYERRSAVQS